MDDVNKHIHEYLTHYVEMEGAPQFAVLLKGKWGVGKTWFIDSFFNDRDKKATVDAADPLQTPPKTHLYVSLYGLKSTSSIDDEFFTQAFPFWGSKGVRIAGSVLRSALKLSTSFDLNHDGKSDLTVNGSLPTNSIFDTAARVSKMVLVFDDLERCSMPIAEVLGYINQFVEHYGTKAILLANEVELKARDEADKNKSAEYLRIKEKLIGKEFDILPDATAAISLFCAQLSEANRPRVTLHTDLIARLYHQSTHDNLRRVRQALLDFDSLAQKLDADLLKNESCYTQLLTLFCIYSLEVGTGHITTADLAALTQWPYLGGFIRQTDEHEEKISAVGKKYVGVDITDTILAPTTWASIISAGHVDIEAANLEIRSSARFSTDELPSWRILWHYADLSEEQFYKVLIDMEQEFDTAHYDQVGVVKHIAGVFLALSEATIYSKQPSDIVAVAKRHIDDLAARGMLLSEHTERWRDATSWGGFGFHGIELPPFKEISAYAEQRTAVAVELNRISEGAELLKIMTSDLGQFTRDLTIGAEGGGRYATAPIFNAINVEQFFQAWLKLSPRDKRYIGYMFEQRYKYLNVFPRAHEELQWLSDLHRLCRDASRQAATTFARRPFDEFSHDVLRPAIDAIETAQNPRR